MILQDLQDKQILQILAEPTITTVSGQKASFLAGGEFPFPVVQASTGGIASVSISFRPYGVKLEFTPTVNADGTIRLIVAPEVSDLDFSNAVTIAGYSIPAISTRRAETEVELRDGQSFAISGLLDHRTTDIYNKMPGFGDIPLLGQLFRSKSTTHSTEELVVIVTPILVDPLTDTTPPVLPNLPVPMLDVKQFDKTVVKQPVVETPQPGTGGKP
jgi:pilus assembly protein CpaC